MSDNPVNPFEAVKKYRLEAAAKGRQLLDMSIGVPAGPALFVGRFGAALACLSPRESMHTVQEYGNRGVPDFCQRFIAAQGVTTRKFPSERVGFLSLPGIKQTLYAVVKAVAMERGRPIRVLTMTNPGYPTPADICRTHVPNVTLIEPELSAANGFMLTVEQVVAAGPLDLIMLNIPHNPSMALAESGFLSWLCEYCQSHNIWLFNDACYAMFTHAESRFLHLADVAVNFGSLQWIDTYTASKLGNFMDWRIAMAIGSHLFLKHITRVKDDFDVGFSAPLAVGVLAQMRYGRWQVQRVINTYRRREDKLIAMLTKRGMRLAIQPAASFFVLWQAPTHAFGQAVANATAFNFLMADRTGVLGVAFGPYIRYAVCRPIEGMMRAIDNAYAQAEVAYD